MKSRKHLGLAFIAVATIGAGTVGFIPPQLEPMTTG